MKVGLGTLSCSLVPQKSWDVGFKVAADGLLVTIEGANARWVGDEEGEMKAGGQLSRLRALRVLRCRHGRQEDGDPLRGRCAALPSRWPAWSVKRGALPSPSELVR